MFELNDECKIIKKLIVIKEISSWLPLGWMAGKVAAENIFI